jgi:hypothetical protein
MCYDIFCFICGNPCHSILDSYIENIKNYIEEDIKPSYTIYYKNIIKQYKDTKNILDDLKILSKNSKWMNKCSMLSVDDKIIHGVEEEGCSHIFCNNKNTCIEHIELLGITYNLDEPHGIFIHTDCWKFIKNKYKIDLKFSNLPPYNFFPKKIYTKIFPIDYGKIEKYWEQEFNFAQIVIDNKKYLCSLSKKSLIFLIK